MQNITNHKTLIFDCSKRINLNHPAMSIKEDYRRGSYFIKHMHVLNHFDEKVYFVFKDNPAPGRNWRADNPLHTSFHNNIEDAISWINQRRCFKK